jgi:hypothetical protein
MNGTFFFFLPSTHVHCLFIGLEKVSHILSCFWWKKGAIVSAGQPHPSQQLDVCRSMDSPGFSHGLPSMDRVGPSLGDQHLGLNFFFGKMFFLGRIFSAAPAAKSTNRLWRPICPLLPPSVPLVSNKNRPVPVDWTTVMSGG